MGKDEGNVALILTGTEPNNNHEYQALKITSARTTTGNKTITYTAGEIDLLESFQVDSASSVNGQIQDFTPTNLAFTYVIRDHLGNNRVFFWDSTGNNSLSTNEIRAVRSYYPFGMDMRQANNINPEFKYGFGDKEELEYTGYLSFGARCMDVTTCRFTSVDRFSAKYAFQSPFSYAASNPLKYIDVNGDSIRVSIGNDQFINYTPGMEYNGTNEFATSIISSLNEINSTESGSAVIGTLTSSENIFDLVNVAPNNSEAGAAFSPSEGGGGVLKLGNANTLSDIAHELFHGYQGETGLTPLGTTAAEVGAYLFQDIVEFERGVGAALPISETKYGKRYDKAHDRLLFKGYSQTDYIRANIYFKFSNRNSSGLYGLTPYKPDKITWVKESC